MRIPDSARPVHSGERSSSAPYRPPFPYEHRLPSWMERLATDHRRSRKRRNGESARSGRDIGLTATALDVLRRMLQWRTVYPDSCWVDRGTLAHNLGVSEKTITRAWRDLERVGALCSDQYGERGDPDPREPRNTTGWRHWFPFVRERLRQGRAPDRRPNHERHRRRRGDILSPVGETILSPVGGDILSPNGSLSTPSELRKETTDDAPARAFEAGTGEPESSSSFDSPPKLHIHHAKIAPEEDPGEEAPADPEAGELDELVDQAVKILTGERPAELPGKIRAAIQAGNPAWWIRDALAKVKRMAPRDGIRRHWGMVLGVLRNFRLEGKPPEEPVAPPPPAPPPIARPPDPPTDPEVLRRTIAELEAKGALRSWEVRLLKVSRDELAAVPESKT